MVELAAEDEGMVEGSLGLFLASKVAVGLAEAAQ